MVRNLHEERAALRRELRDMERGLRLMSARAEHARKRAREMGRECARIERSIPESRRADIARGEQHRAWRYRSQKR